MTDVERLREELEGLLVKFNERLTGEPHSLNVLVAGRFLVADFEAAVRADERGARDRAWLAEAGGPGPRGLVGQLLQAMGYEWRDGAWHKEAQT